MVTYLQIHDIRLNGGAASYILGTRRNGKSSTETNTTTTTTITNANTTETGKSLEFNIIYVYR